MQFFPINRGRYLSVKTSVLDDEQVRNLRTLFVDKVEIVFI